MSVECYKVILAAAQICIYGEQTNNSKSVHYYNVWYEMLNECQQQGRLAHVLVSYAPSVGMGYFEANGMRERLCTSQVTR